MTTVCMGGRLCQLLRRGFLAGDAEPRRLRDDWKRWRLKDDNTGDRGDDDDAACTNDPLGAPAAASDASLPEAPAPAPAP